jgi:hypothetical protein
MAENKTKPTEASVTALLDQIEDANRREDCLTLVSLMQEVTGEPAVMWGSSIVGFGKYRYKYQSGRTGEAQLTGFSPRKQNLTLYITSGFEQFEPLMRRLGRHKTGKSCLYLNALQDVDMAVLRELISRSVEHMRATNPG